MAGKCELIIKIAGKRENLSVNSFLDTFTGAIEAIRGICQSFSIEENSFGLDIKRINISSPGDIIITENIDTNPDIAKKVFDKMRIDFDHIEEKGEFPFDINQKTIDGYNKIAQSLNNGIKSISLQTPNTNEKIYEDSFSKQYTIAIKVESEKCYFSFSTYVGRLLYLDLHSKPNTFRIYDRFINRYLKCQFDEIHKSVAIIALEKRVSVRGKTKYNKLNNPINMVVENIEILPEDNQIPKYKDIPIVDITNGQDSYDFVRRMRDASE